MTILSFFTLNIPIRRLWTNLYHKEDHFLKIWPLLHYFSEIYLKICDFALFLKNFFCPLKKKHVLMNYNIFGKTIRNYRNRLDLKVCLRWKFICKVVVIPISLPKAITCEGLISKNWERVKCSTSSWSKIFTSRAR